MFPRLLELVVRITTHRWRTVLVGLAMILLAVGSGLVWLERDPSPNTVLAAYGGRDVIQRDLRRTFGDSDRISLVVVEADDILAPAALAYLHELSLALSRTHGVARVDSLTLTSLPHQSQATATASPRPASAAPSPTAPEQGESIDPESAALEAEIAGEPPPRMAPATNSASDIEAAIAGQHPGAASEPALPPRAPAGLPTPELTERILPLVEGDTRHFPHGLRSLAERAEESGLRGGPVVQGEQVDRFERAALIAAVEASPLITGRLISRDRTAAIIAAYLDSSLVSHEAMAACVARIDAVLAQRPAPAGIRVSTGGLPHLRGEIVTNMNRDLRRVLPAAFGVCVLLLLIAFRWWPGVLFPMIVVGSSAVMLLGLMGWTRSPLTIVNNILPTLLVITCISDSVHLVARYRFEIQQGRQQLLAVKDTMYALTFACLLTSVTNAIGFASLAAASTPMLRQFGLLAAGGVLLAYLVTIAFMPAALISVAPPRDAPSGRRAASAERVLVGLTRKLVKRPWPILGLAALALAPSLWAASRVNIDMKLLDMFSEDDQVSRSTRLIEEKFQGIRPLEIVLSSSRSGRFLEPRLIAALDEVKVQAKSHPEVLGAFSYSDVLHEVNALVTGDPSMRREPFRNARQVEALSAVAEAERAPDGTLLRLGAGGDPLTSPIARHLTRDGNRARLTIMLADVGARRSMMVIQAIDGHLRERLVAFPDVTYDLTGEAYLGSFGINGIVTDLFYGLVVAVGVIFVILALLFRSVPLGILSIPPNVMPLFGTLGYMRLRGIDLTPANVIIFAISVGLGVSATVHVLARYRLEVVRGLGGRTALVRAARSTGTGNLWTAFIVSLGFSVLSLSSFVTIRQFGELIAVTVLICLLAAVLVLPALLAVASPWLVPQRAGGSRRNAAREQRG